MHVAAMVGEMLVQVTAIVAFAVAVFTWGMALGG